MLLIVAASALPLARPLAAQEAPTDSVDAAIDTVDVPATPPDTTSLGVASDSTRFVVRQLSPKLSPKTPARYLPPDAAPVPGGRAVDLGLWSIQTDSLILPAVSPAMDTEHLLASVPGSFLYDMGPPGWPHGWSPEGLDPASVGLTAFGLPWNDPLTGRPQFDLLPVSFFEPLTVESSHFGGVVGVSAELREHAASRPVTELRYWKGASNLQSIVATHAQRRRIGLFGGSELSVLGGYGGRASAGEYPGSRLRRERHVLARIGLERPTWHVDLLDLHARHQVGAHGGVLQRSGQGPESVFDRFGARVENERAIRRTVRNDLVGELGLPFRLIGMKPVVRGFWTAHSFHYRDPRDTLSVETDRVGGMVNVEKRSDRSVQSVFAYLASEQNELSWAEKVSTPLAYQIGIQAGLTRGRFSATIKESFGNAHGGSLTNLIHASYEGARVGTFVHLASGSDPSALIYGRGFGTLVRPVEEEDHRWTRVIRAGATLREGPLTLGLTAFASRALSGNVLVPVSGDTAAVGVAESIRRLGVTLQAGLRASARRGFYLDANATTMSITGDGTIASRLEDSVPALFGSARGGMRYRLFRGDLDLHVYLEVRAWSAFRSRMFHAPTGLLILPEANAEELGPSSTIGAYVEAGVREATLFIAWENLAAGTGLMDGTMLVPVYPLPEQALRFGVFWPIWD